MNRLNSGARVGLAPSPRRAGGFTLIEILVVLTLVSIISVGAFALLDSFNATDRALETRAEELRRFSMAMYRMDDDLRQLTVRPVKNAYTGYEPALRGDADELEFTRLGAANLTGEPRGELQRLSYSVGYAESDDRDDLTTAGEGQVLLLRSRWRVLDRAPDSEAVVEPLLQGVDGLSLRYYEPQTETWLSQWPPVSSQVATGIADVRLPAAIELVLLTRNNGELRRVFALPSGAVAAVSNQRVSGASVGSDDDETDGQDDADTDAGNAEDSDSNETDGAEGAEQGNGGNDE